MSTLSDLREDAGWTAYIVCVPYVRWPEYIYACMQPSVITRSRACSVSTSIGIVLWETKGKYWLAHM